MKKTIDKVRNNKLLNLIITIIKTIVWLALIVVVLVLLVQRVFNDMEVSLAGYRMFNVVTKSMEPEYKVGDIIITKETKVEDINIGDTVTYLGNRYDFEGVIITHKVISKRENEGTHYFTTKGIANEIADPEIEYSQIYGKVIYKVLSLSYISKLMNNQLAYYLIFMLVGIIVSIQIASSIFEVKKSIEEDDIDAKGAKK